MCVRRRLHRQEHPSCCTRDQDRSFIVSVVVHDRFYERFVMVRIGLGIEKGSFQSPLDLFEEGTRQIVDQSHQVGNRQVGVIVFLGHKFQVGRNSPSSR